MDWELFWGLLYFLAVSVVAIFIAMHTPIGW